MSKNNQLCLKGSQILPKPRSRNYKSDARSVTISTLRPNSATHDNKYLSDKSSEVSSRPKSANDISLYEGTRRNSSSKSRYFTKAFHPQKSPKAFNCRSYDHYSCQNKKIVTSYDETPVPSKNSSRNEVGHKDVTYSITSRIAESTVKDLPNKSYTEENDLLNVPKSVLHANDELSKLPHSKNCKWQVDTKDEENAGLINSKGIEKAAYDAVDGTEITNSTHRQHKLSKANEDVIPISEVKNESRISFANNLIDLNSEEENRFKTADIASVESTLVSLLAELDYEAMSSSLQVNTTNSSNGFESNIMPKGSSNSFLSCQQQSFSVHSEVDETKKLEELCVSSHPHRRSDENCCDSEILLEIGAKNEQTICKNSSQVLSKFSSNYEVEDGSAINASPFKQVHRILKVSKENLQKDIVDILNIQKDSFQCPTGKENFEEGKIIVGRPSCVGESSGSWNELMEMEGNERKMPDVSQIPITSLIQNIPGSTEERYNKLNDVPHSTEMKIKNSPMMLAKNPFSENAKKSEEQKDSDQNKMSVEEETKQTLGNFNLDLTNGDFSDDDSMYDDILSTLKVLEKEENEPAFLSSRPPPTGSESEYTPRIKLKDILSFLDNVDQSCISTINTVTSDLRTLETGSTGGSIILPTKKSEVDILSQTASSNQILEMRLQEQAKGLSLLKKELEETRQRSQKEKEKLGKDLNEEHKIVLGRHQAFIEKLLSEKKSLGDKCESLALKLLQAEENHKRNIVAMEERHALTLRNESERIRLEQRATRDKWMREKTQKIQAVTAKGAEGEVTRLVSEQARQIEALWRARLDELRGRLEREAEEGMAKEREIARKRLEERMEEMERFHQEERRKFLSEECLLRGRAEEAERKVREVEDDARRRRADDLDAERARSQANLEKATQEMENHYKISLSKEKTQREAAVEAARKEEREMMEAERRKWEAKLRDRLRSERDQGIEKAVAHLSIQAEKAQRDADSRAEMSLRRMRERCDEQVRIAEEEAEKHRKQCADARSQSAALQEEVMVLKVTVTRLEKELEAAHKMNSTLYEERAQIRDLVVEEWSARVAALREEVGVLKAQIAGEKERREMELNQVQKEREHELIQVQKRVEIAVAKKEESICHIKTKYEAALKKCSQLQELLEKQRKDLLLK